MFRDKQEDVDASEYMFENQKSVIEAKMPGKINGQQFVIQNCEVSIKRQFFSMLCIFDKKCSKPKIFLADHLNQLCF